MKAEQMMKALGFNEPWEIPLYMPVGMEDNRLVIQDFNPYYLPSGQQAIYSGYVKNFKTRWSNNKPRLQIELTDGELSVYFSLFGDQRDFMDVLESNPNMRLNVKGTVVTISGRLFLNDASLVNEENVSRITPEYPSPQKSGGRDVVNLFIREHAQKNLKNAAEKVWAELNEKLSCNNERIKAVVPNGEMQIYHCLKSVHYPEDLVEAREAYSVLKRILLEATAADVANRTCLGPTKPLLGKGVGALISNIPFPLTDEQLFAVNHAIQFIREGRRFRGALIADVGAGKTCVFLLICAYCISAGGRAVVLLPNESIAQQVHEEFQSYFPEYHASLITGANQGDINASMLIGTTALNFRASGHTFDIQVTDEQQKLSVEQREVLDSIHTLEVTATPIPRSAAIAKLGAVEVLTLKHCHTPKEIITRIVPAEAGDWLMSEVKNTLSLGAKVLIVCAKRSENNSKSDLQSVERIAYAMHCDFPGQVRMMHSGLSNEENALALSDVKSGRANILVSSTKVEVGVTIPELRHGIIYSAERLGLTTLHQLRGRLARKAPLSGVNWGKFDLFLPKPVGEKAMQRLQVLVDTTDGFLISERDMEIRGVGDLRGKGKKQHGSADYLFRNMTINPIALERVVEAIK